MNPPSASLRKLLSTRAKCSLLLPAPATSLEAQGREGPQWKQGREQEVGKAQGKKQGAARAGAADRGRRRRRSDCRPHTMASSCVVGGGERVLCRQPMVGLLLVVCLCLCLCQARDSSSTNIAQLIRHELLEDGSTLSATYDSSLFGQSVSVTVRPNEVYLTTFAPTTVFPVAGVKLQEMVVLNETFPLPANSSNYTAIDHITVFYDPSGAFPYPAGMHNPMWSPNISSSFSCVTCWFYITFSYISLNETRHLVPQCHDSPTLFCSSDQLQWAVTEQPPPSLLPPSFRNATGDFYDAAVVQAAQKGTALDRLHSIANSVTPLLGFQLGQVWVDGKSSPYTFHYNGTTVLAPANYYLTDSGAVIGVGQVVSRDYFQFFSTFFANSDPTLHKIVNTAGPFGVPSNYSENGYYPGKALSELNGFQGTTTFKFGFSNTTLQMAPTPPNAAASLVLNLPWLMASVWIAGAVVLLSDHL